MGGGAALRLRLSPVGLLLGASWAEVLLALDSARRTSAALAASAKNDGQPGLREEYHPSYYGAFVVDPDGHPIEAVCHLPVAAAFGAVAGQ